MCVKSISASLLRKGQETIFSQTRKLTLADLIQ